MKTYYCKKCNKEITTGSKSGFCGSCSHLGYKHTAETKEKISKATKIRFQDPKEREKHSIASKKRWSDPKEHEKHKIAMNKQEVKKKMSGKNSIHYVHGYGHEPYSKDFTPALKKEIHQRDNYTCQCCGMTQEEHITKYNKQLEIHHIDHDKFNCNPDNLITICHKCNMKANKDIDYYYAYYTYIMEDKNVRTNYRI
jgi:hypothetical protein